ncbi:hypothetical protein [Butyrivibrio sp.]|jgi:hypothetical protein|uniref:hypothetical protein n=1 Tax=Butyrivibrio sp. TaxID=28121 RepID=UPI0025C157E0|nr:hypothetical protein [Butyrivibrio sp.]MBE5837542.1 hypothetical protein [Butyrivibrio sp.]MBE5843190.1 hypothetical protein [Butyrivibrio sp.]
MKKEFSDDELEYYLKNFRPPENELFRRRLKKRLTAEKTGSDSAMRKEENMSDNAQKLVEIFKDEELVKEVVMIENAEKAQQWFSKHGVELTMDDIGQMAEKLNKAKRGQQEGDEISEDGELFEDDLEAVAGGAGGISGFLDAFTQVMFNLGDIFVGW